MNNSLSASTGSNGTYAAAHVQQVAAPSLLNLVNLNEVVHNVLVSKRQRLDEIKAIIRYDALPSVKGEAVQFSILFNHIINSILDHPPSGTKLLMYIRCEKEKSEVVHRHLPEDFVFYSICVFTNIIAGAGWQQLQQQKLAEEAAIVEKANGSFTFHPIQKTGCLYMIALPGKLI